MMRRGVLLVEMASWDSGRILNGRAVDVPTNHLLNREDAASSLYLISTKALCSSSSESQLQIGRTGYK